VPNRRLRPCVPKGESSTGINTALSSKPARLPFFPNRSPFFSLPCGQPRRTQHRVLHRAFRAHSLLLLHHGRHRRQPTALVNGFYLADEEVFLGYRLVPGPNGGVPFHYRKNQIQIIFTGLCFPCAFSRLVVVGSSLYSVFSFCILYRGIVAYCTEASRAAVSRLPSQRLVSPSDRFFHQIFLIFVILLVYSSKLIRLLMLVDRFSRSFTARTTTASRVSDPTR
jgi:hypothetical protein